MSMKNIASREVIGLPSDHFQFLYLIVTVVSLLLHTGSEARLIAGSSFCCDPFGNQLVGRHISYWKEYAVYTDPLAPGVTGKIHVGVAPGGSATVIVPACGVPVWAGTEPNAPLMVGATLLVELLLQAARAVAPTTAQTATFITGWATFIRSPCSQGGHGGWGRPDACQERG